MKKVRSTINAMLVAVLLKPMVRRSIARWRREARESAEGILVIPAQELLETVLAARLAPAEARLRPAAEQVVDVAGRDLRRTALILAAVVGLAAASAITIVAWRRRRRAAVPVQPTEVSEPIVISVEVPAEEPEAAGTQVTTPPASE